MAKENNVMKAIVKLAMCSGNRDTCSYCSRCSHSHYGDKCAEQLRKDYGYVLDGVFECLESSSAKHGPTPPKTLVTCVTDTLRMLGIPASIMGYRYLREAILIIIKDESMLDCITCGLYPAVAKIFDTTPSRVERAIRHAVGVSWDRCDLEVLHEYFGCTVSLTKGKPTNSEFIAMVADKVRLKMLD